MVAPAVVASPSSSSSGAVPTQGRCGRSTLTRMARSARTVISWRVSSKVGGRLRRSRGKVQDLPLYPLVRQAGEKLCFVARGKEGGRNESFVAPTYAIIR